MHTLLTHFDAAYAIVSAGGSLTAEWAALLDTLGLSVRLRRAAETIKGVAESIDERGNLLVCRPDGSLYTATAGEVTSQA